MERFVGVAKADALDTAIDLQGAGAEKQGHQSTILPRLQLLLLT